MVATTPIDKMTDEQFQSYLTEKFGLNSYGLKILHAENATMKGRVKLQPALTAPAPATTAPVPETANPKPEERAAKPVPPVVDLSSVDLDAYGRRWQAGESIADLAREIGKVSWNYLHGVLTRKGFHKGSK
jgi:hypothetical protein